MPLRVQCSAGHLMMVPDHRAGTMLRCAKCGIDVHVPGGAARETNDASLPRVSLPAIAQREAKRVEVTGVAAGQSPRIAGHSTSSVSPALVAAKLKTPRTERGTIPPREPAVVRIEGETAPEKSPGTPPANQTVAPAAVLTVPTEVEPAVTREMSDAAAVDAALLDTIVLPASIPAEKPAEPLATEPTTNAPPPPQRGTLPAPQTETAPAARPAMTLTGTMLAPALATILAAEPEAPPITESFATEPQPPMTAEPSPAAGTIGVRPTSSQRFTAWQLAAALAAAALLAMGPAFWEISDFLQSDGGQSVARWAFLLLVLGVIQIGSVALLVQVPDWSSVWVVTIQSLALAAIYAAVLGLTAITRGDSPLIGALQLDYQYSTGKAAPWSICMAATYACLAFFAGRISSRWRKGQLQLRAANQVAADY